MTVEIIVAGAAVVGVLFTGGGLILTWRKNGRSQRERDLDLAMKQAARDTAINTTQENILAKLDDPTTGLPAVNEKVNAMVTHCAEVSTGVVERVNAAERDIKEVKARQNKAP